MFISVLELFKVGIGPSSSHTMGPVSAAHSFIALCSTYLADNLNEPFEGHYRLRCTLRGSLAHTGKGHGTDRAVVFGLHGYDSQTLARETDLDLLASSLWCKTEVSCAGSRLTFLPDTDILFDCSKPLPQHPNGMIFELHKCQQGAEVQVLSKTYFSIGGGFVSTLEEIEDLVAPIKFEGNELCRFPFDSGESMLAMAEHSGLSVAQMKYANELERMTEQDLNAGLDQVWHCMKTCLERGLTGEGVLPGGLDIPRRAASLYRQLKDDRVNVSMTDWLCAYAMAVNEENAAGHMVVTAPTNGAAGVIPAVIYYLLEHEGGSEQSIRDFLLTAAAIGGLIKHRSSISGAEVGCQGEVGSAAAMAAAGLVAAKGGSVRQVEHAAEVALEHHLGMTCDPVKGLVQVPCIERNGFGAVKAYTAASLALRGSGEHFMPLDNCIEAMRQTGQEMSEKFKETSLGGLAVNISEC